MVHSMPHHLIQTLFSPIPLAIGLFVSVSILIAMCAKHVRKYSSETSETSTAKSPLPSVAKQLIATIRHKAMMPLVHAKKSGFEFNAKIFGNNNNDEKKKMGQDKESGLWHKAILMGEKCQPLEFSGMIYYDHAGNRIPEMPKSPRAGPMRPLRGFTFPVEKIDTSTSMY
ncbi:hypothetical protein OROHE_023083 [Orobanche hederae]